MYTIIGFDIINGGRTTKKFCKPIECSSISEINDVQKRIQAKQQAKHQEPIEVLCFYKVLIKDHIKW